jgi:hypothetical protein
MSETIWKFPFQIANEVTIPMPKGATVLTVALQRGVPCLWAIVDPSASTTERHFSVRGTGHPLGFEVRNRFYVGSIQMMDGDLVFHVFGRSRQ